MRKKAGILLAAALVATGACGKKQPPPSPAPPAPARTTVAAPAQDPDAADRARREAEARRLAEEAARNRAILEERVFFAYDKAELSSSAQAILQAKIPVLRADPSIRLRIEGHADERGSLEYNLALGMRRARAVSSFLSGFNIDGARLAVDSFGEERPLDPGHTEASWARNRRADFTVTGGSSATGR